MPTNDAAAERLQEVRRLLGAWLSNVPVHNRDDHNESLCGVCSAYKIVKELTEGAALRQPAAQGVEQQGHWWCERCYSEKSPVQVTYQETCTKCGEPVEWEVEPPQP